MVRLQGSGQPGPAQCCRSVQAIVKMVCTSELSLRGRFAPVAISGRHLQSVQAIVKMVCTSELSLRGGRRPTWQSREGTCSPYRPSLKWYALPNCHCEGASRPWQSHAPTSEFAEVALLSTRGLRDCTPRALPRAARSGRHVGLRPPRNDKLGGLAPLNCCCTTCNCLRRSGSAAAAEPSKYPGMHP